MHGGGSAPSCCAFTHRVAFEEGLSRSGGEKGLRGSGAGICREIFLCLENPRDRGAGWAAVYGVAQSRTQLKRVSSSSSKVRALLEEHKKGTMNRSTTGLPVDHQLLEFTQLMSMESVMPSSHLILCVGELHPQGGTPIP